MKKYLLLINLLLTLTIGYAQTQYGYVKTKGRLTASGTVIPGARLAGATITLNTRNVVTLDKGAFSFPTSGKSFLVKDIKKNGYQLYDRDQLKSYTYSSNPLILVLEKPEEYEQDKLQKQQQISRTLRRQLAKREDEIERLKEEKKISEQEYQRLYNELYSNDKKNQELIEDMAKRYALMDFDNMDETNLKIKTYILNGELERADSLINSKGSLEDRKKEFLKMQEANKQEETAIAQRQENLNKSKELAKKTLLDLAEDYMNKFEVCKLQNKYDSAAYYIEERASLDTLNWVWQFNAAYYFNDQNSYNKSESYYLRTWNILSSETSEIYDIDKVTITINLGNLYNSINRFSDCERMYQKALNLNDHLSKKSPKIFKRNLGSLGISLGNLYYSLNEHEKSEKLYKDALYMFQQLAKEDTISYEKDVAVVLLNLGNEYSATNRFDESENSYKSGLNIFQQLAKDDQKTYEPRVAMSLQSLGNLYYKTAKYEESENNFNKALDIWQRFVKINPKAYESYFAMTQHCLGKLYIDTKRFTESEKLLKAALHIYQRLAKVYPQIYEITLAEAQKDLGDLYIKTNNLHGFETMYKLSLENYQKLAKDNINTYEGNIINIQNHLGHLYSYTKRFAESEKMFKMVMETYKQLGKDNPREYERQIASTHFYLSLIYSQIKDYQKTYNSLKECISIWDKYKDDGSITIEDYTQQLNNLSFYCNAIGKFEEGEKHSREALAVDSTLHLAYTNLAASLLMQGKYTEAEKIYIQYKGELKDGFLDDLKVFAEQGVIPKEREADVERIKQLLNK